MIEPPGPYSLLRVRVGGKRRDLELCVPGDVDSHQAIRRKVAARAALELLIAVRGLLPREAYDYRASYRVTSGSLPSFTGDCAAVHQVP
jgi:hypothetical protein